MIRVAIVGAGKAGAKLLDIFKANGVVKTVGITDKDPNAPALELARQWGIFIADDIVSLCGQQPDIILNVTGDPQVSSRIREAAPPGADVIEGNGAWFLWEMVQRQRNVQTDMRTLYENGLTLTSAKSLQEVLEATLEKAMELTESPAGSIALYERNEMVMAVSRGMRAEVAELNRWKLRPDGLTAHILSRKEPVEIRDIHEHPLFDSRTLQTEGIRSVLAYPLMVNGGMVGILFLDDFAPRIFSDRHKNLISLFGTQAAQAIEKFRILNELYSVITDLDETTAYLKNVLDDSQDMIMTTTTDGVIVEFSRGGERILGYTREEIVGKRAADFYADRDERAAILDTIRRKGAICNHETTLIRKDGAPVDISLTISQLRNKTGKVIGTVGISKDITEEKRLRNELRDRNEELKELTLRLEDKVMERTRELEKINRELLRANQVKARFISNMSHELRTPLNSILGFSEILIEKTFGSLNDKQERHVSNIAASGKHLLQLVNNILDLAKIESGKIELSYEEFSICEAIDEVVLIMQFLCSRKSISLSVEVEPDVRTFSADKVKFKQILYNLISNAVKFTPEGGTVGVRAGFVVNRLGSIPWALEGQTLLRVSVWDKGIGIKEEDIDRIFEEFEQVDSSMARTFQGTGLGLALTKRLVDLHGGQVGVQSVYGEGSEFFFHIPSVLPDRRPEEDHAFAPLSLTFPWLKEEAPLVLVVEDDLPTSEILTIHLSKAGYKVVHAYDGLEAIEKARDLKPFLIALDVMLPKKDGWEVLQSLKADPETSGIPVIIHSIIDNKDLAYALGATDYLLKPVDKTVLLRKLDDLVLVSRRPHLPLSVLLISADAATRNYMSDIFGQNSYIFNTASHEEEGLELAAASRPGLILIDLATCGFDLIKKLKAHAATMGIPIFALTNKDLSMEERMSLTGQIERILTRDSLVAQDLIMHLKDLEMLHPRRAGLIDELTGLFNHRYLQLRLAQEVKRAARYKTPLSLILLDIDRFSHYVREKGEYHGNLVLRKTAELLKRSIRGSDVVVRYAGDAFSVILPNTLRKPAVSLGRRFHSIIRDYPFLHEEVQPKGRITASLGVASFREQSPEKFIECAEIALALAVRKGGDSVEVFNGNG